LQTLIRFNSSLSTSRTLCSVKRFTAQRIRKIGQRSTIIDSRLRSLGFQLIQNPSHLNNLLLLKLQFMCEKPQRPANPKPAETLFIRTVTAMMPVARRILFPAIRTGLAM
jgi:hypothetical protein